MDQIVIDTSKAPTNVRSVIRIQYKGCVGKKAIFMVDVDYSCLIGSYKDRHTVEMAKTEEENFCTRDAYELWK